MWERVERKLNTVDITNNRRYFMHSTMVGQRLKRMAVQFRQHMLRFLHWRFCVLEKKTDREPARIIEAASHGRIMRHSD